MADRDFKDIKKIIPAEDGTYQWETPRQMGRYIVKVLYVKGLWYYYSNGDQIPGRLVKWWR